MKKLIPVSILSAVMLIVPVVGHAKQSIWGDSARSTSTQSVDASTSQSIWGDFTKAFLKLFSF